MLDVGKEYDHFVSDKAIEQAINLGCQVRKYFLL